MWLAGREIQQIGQNFPQAMEIVFVEYSSIWSDWLPSDENNEHDISRTACIQLNASAGSMLRAWVVQKWGKAPDAAIQEEKVSAVNPVLIYWQFK